CSYIPRILLFSSLTFTYSSDHLPDLPSFPTRRSSDLPMNRDKPHCITSFFYFYLVASIHQLAGYELYTLSLSILSHNESLIGHMLCITNMCDINTSLINLSSRVYRCQWINGY